MRTAAKYQGSPCKHGHRGIRYKSTRNCVECLRAAAKKWIADNRPRHLESKRTRYRQNAEKMRAAGRARHRRHPWVGRVANWKRLGIDCTWEQYQELLGQQGGRCAICNRAPQGERDLCLDHDHATRKPRGVLCIRCNNLVGQIEGGLAHKAEDYLGRIETSLFANGRRL